MLNTRFYVAAPGTPPPQPEFRAVYRGEDATVFRDPAALPRAYVVSRTTERSYEASLAMLAEGRVDARDAALVPPGSPSLPRSAASFRPARVELLGPDHVRVSLEPGPPGWLVLANSYCSCWEAEVDGRETAIHPTNVVSMGLPVPAGAQAVDFRLDRSSLWLGAALSLVGFAAIAGLALAGGRVRLPGGPGGHG
jgi:hypothetical protein